MKRFLAAGAAILMSFPSGVRGEIVPKIDARRLNIAAAQRSFFVPGLGQWHKGDEVRACAIWGLEAGFLGLSYHSFRRARAAENDFRAGRAPYSRHTRKVDQGNFFLAAAGAVWFYGVMDAYFAAPSGNGVSAGLTDQGEVRIAWNVRF